MHLLSCFSLLLAVSATFCQAQDDLQNLEGTPFLIDGVQYRDMLTISASQAVGTFAGRFQPQERQRINDRSRNPSPVQAAQFFSNTLSQPIGEPSWEGAIHYGEALSVRIPNTLAQDRLLADRDEDILTSEDRSPPANIHTINSGRPSGFRSSSSSSTPNSRGLTRPRSRGLLNRVPAASFGNYQSVVGHGHSYSTGAAPAAAAPPPAPAAAFSPVGPSYSTTTSYTPFSPSPALYPATYASSTVAPAYDYGPTYAPAPAPAYDYEPYSPTGSGGARTVDYQIQVHHGDPGGSYSYSTFGRR